jgi:cytochrome c biogenesis protein CcmG/thiol:disulfide interchange protein DsbE
MTGQGDPVHHDGTVGDTAPDGADVVVEEVPVGGRRFSLMAASVLAVVVVALVAVLATRAPSSERKEQSPLLGRIAPAVKGATLAGGTVDIDDYRGRWVMVNFFASWCTPCRVEHPELTAFDEEHKAAGDAVLVGVTYDNKEADAKAFFAERGGTWPVINDPENSIGVAYGVAQVPETFVVSPDGVVVQHFPGGVTQADLDNVIKAFEGPGGAG